MRVIEGREIKEGKGVDFLHDAANAIHSAPESIEKIYFPETESELAAVIRHACEAGIRVTVSGARTGVTGASVASGGGIIIAMESMLTISAPEGVEVKTARSSTQGEISFIVDRNASEAVLPPGISLDSLSEILEREGFWYPPNPTEKSAQLGGTVATNASGGRSFSFGATREYVMGLRVVLPDGDVLVLRRGEIFAKGGRVLFTTQSGNEYRVPLPEYRMPPVKNAAGLYAGSDIDLLDLFVGCEGVLGVFSEVTIALEKRRDIATGMLFFKTEEDALGFVASARKIKTDRGDFRSEPDREGLGILSLEYFDGNALGLARSAQKIPVAGAAVEYECFEGDALTLEKILQLYDEHNAIDDFQGDEVANLRHSVPEAVNDIVRRSGTHKLGTDFAVPPENFRVLYDRCVRAREEFETRVGHSGVIHSAMWGHVGDCHLHFNLIPRDAGELQIAREIYLGLAKKAVELGGTISAEHGVGKKTISVDGQPRPYIWLMYGDEGLRQIKNAKAALDPKFILNRGNMIPAE